ADGKCMVFRAHERRLLHELRNDEFTRECFKETKAENVYAAYAVNVD
ncbi:MAG: hypothetical protein RIR26_2875, partial [Pseudomonadota bacterium]